MFSFILDCVKLARGVLWLDYIWETASLVCRGSNQLLLSFCARVFLSACCHGLCKRRRIWLTVFGFQQSCGRDRVRVCMSFFRHMVFNLRLEPSIDDKLVDQCHHGFGNDFVCMFLENVYVKKCKNARNIVLKLIKYC